MQSNLLVISLGARDPEEIEQDGPHGPTDSDTESDTESDTDPPGPRLEVVGKSLDAAPAAHLVVGFRQGGTVEEAASAVAADLAQRLHATVHVVHVVILSDYPIGPDVDDWEEQARATLAEERRAVDTALYGHGVAWTYHAGHGDPALVLRRVADECDALMFVVGSRGEGVSTVLSRLLEPSVSHHLIARTHRPVVVVPPHAGAGKPRQGA